MHFHFLFSFTLGVTAAGHSLGGAVALLCTLRLLQSLAGSTPSLQCICFGTPAIGNAALAAVVAEYGWESHILNFILPGTLLNAWHCCRLHLQSPLKRLCLSLCLVALDMHDNSYEGCDRSRPILHVVSRRCINSCVSRHYAALNLAVLSI